MLIIALTPVYNEEQTIAKSIEDSLDNGLVPIVLDNGCTDNTMDIVKSLGVQAYQIITPVYSHIQLIKFGVCNARKLGCDWYVLKDADEIFTTYSGLKVCEEIEKADRDGYNCMDMDLYEFYPTTADDMSISDYTERIKYYTFLPAPEVRIIKSSPEISKSHTHFADGTLRMSPVKLILAHYKFLGLEHGKAKVKARRERYDPLEIAQGSHTHYKYFTDESKYYVLEEEIYSKLHKFDGTWVRTQVFDGWRNKR